MVMLEFTCPYCGQVTSIASDGFYTPKYHYCRTCAEKFIYEPLKNSVATYRLGEADSYTDPELREIEACSYDEQ